MTIDRSWYWTFFYFSIKLSMMNGGCYILRALMFGDVFLPWNVSDTSCFKIFQVLIMIPHKSISVAWLLVEARPTLNCRGVKRFFMSSRSYVYNGNIPPPQSACDPSCFKIPQGLWELCQKSKVSQVWPPAGTTWPPGSSGNATSRPRAFFLFRSLPCSGCGAHHMKHYTQRP